jgi:hypothetical protein
MTFVLSAAIVLSQDAQPAAPTPQALISQMVSKYAKAPTLNGAIEAEILVKGERVRVSTEVSYVRPNRLAIRQAESFKGTRNYLVVSDGVGFVYSNPVEDLRKREPLLYEPAVRTNPPRPENNFQRTLESLTIGDIYVAGSQSLADRSVPLDLAIGRREDLEFLQGQLVEVKDGGDVVFNGQRARRIFGPWRPFAQAAHALAQYELFITPEADLVGYRMTENFRVKGEGRNAREVDVQMVSTWKVAFQVGAPIEGSRFRLPRIPGREQAPPRR